MGKLEAYICSIYAFVPAVAFFCRFVAKEPLRIILFMIGAFFWLCSLLLTSVEWRLINIFISLPILTLIVFVINQEISRVLFFIVARKAYDGLTKLGTSNQIVIPEVELLAHSSRHTFSFVCGLGFGTIACFFSIANVIADLTIDGVPGLPASVEKNDCPIHRTFDDVDVPYAYAMACSILIFLNAAWTILQWDSCYKFLQSRKNKNENGRINGEIAADVPLEKFCIGGWHWYILSAQALLLLITTTVTMFIVGFKAPQNWKTFFISPLYFKNRPSSAVIITNNDEDEQINRTNEIIHQPSTSELSNNVTPEAV
uniref:Uncharacterized protein n=1 Tax=Panagrolaimus sp. PS1159 TaxID=55785 RepID=A0AC35GMU7_9BILA